MDFKVCPDDTMAHVVALLKAVWQMQSQAGKPLANVYISDNITKEKCKSSGNSPFAKVPPSLWNSLPLGICECDDLDAFN